MKNLFGMIPDPVRAWYHGPKNQRFANAILDITKIYASLFNVYGICEALKTRAIKASEGEYGVSTFRYNVANNLGIIAYGRHPVSLDAILCDILGFDFKDAPYLQLAEKDFGSYDNTHIKEAINKVNNWFF